MLKRLLLSVSAVIIFTVGLPVFSENAVPVGSQQQSVNINTSSSGTAASPLKGGVQKVELSLEKLRDVGLDLKSALKATTSLYDEVTIQPVRLITQPEMIGSGTIINVPIGTEPTGPPQPARKKQVDLAMSGMKPVIDMLKKNADEFMSGEKQLDLPQSVNARLQPQFKSWVSTVNDIALFETRLEQITQSPPYDNATIAQLTAAIQQSIKDLEKIRLSIYKVIRKEGKRVSSPKV